MHNPNKNIVDGFGRVHDYLRISLTERCNLRCFYCMPEEGVPLREKSAFMNAEETIEIAKTFVDMGVKKIRLTGGEPLIKKNAEFIIRELGKLPIELAITTNGVVVDRFINVMKEAGVKSVNVSLDSLQEERFNTISRRNFFAKITDNINLLINEGFKVKINVVVMRGVNDDEVCNFIHWTKKTNVNIRFIEFMPFDGNKWNWDKKVSYKEIMTQAENHFGNDGFYKVEDQPNDTSRNFRLLGGEGTFGIISSVTNPFCDTCNRIRLTADGKIKNCLFSSDETDLLSAFRSGLDLKRLIRNTVFEKQKARGGIGSFDDNTVRQLKNRSMVTIGG